MDYEDDELRLSDILQSVISHKFLVIILTVLGLFIGVVVSFVSYTLGEISKEYAITTSIAVTAQFSDGTFADWKDNLTLNDYHLAEDMADAVVYILKSDKLLNAAIEQMDLIGVPPQNISTHLSIAKYKETQIIEITLYWRSAEEGVRIMNAINEVAPTILNETLKIGNVSVVNEPLAKYRVGGSFNWILWVVCAAVGFVLSIVICVIQTCFFPTVVNSEDLEDMLNVELLGEIPANKQYYQQKLKNLSDEADHVGSNVRDGYATAAYAVKNLMQGKTARYIYITSARAGEGKTEAVANLALQLSRQEHKVLMIDLDTKNPSLGSLFFEKVPFENTLNAVYQGSAEVDTAIVHLNSYLDMLPAVLDRKEIPLDDTMLAMIKELGDKYEYIFMDTTSLSDTADVMRLNVIASGVILVVRFDRAPLYEVKDTVKRLEKCGANIIGGIFNGVRVLNGDMFTLKPKTESSAQSKERKQKRVKAQKDGN